MDVSGRFERMTAAGVRLQVDGDDLDVQSPWPLTDEQRHWLREHKAELVALLAAQEAADERAAILEYEGQLQRQDAERVAGLAQDYYRHLFGTGKDTGCCFAPAGRLCPEGERLRDIYFQAAERAGPSR